jgi:hypothetical protein
VLFCLFRLRVSNAAADGDLPTVYMLSSRMRQVYFHLLCCLCRVRVTDAVADGELLKAFELSRQKYKTRKQQVRPWLHSSAVNAEASPLLQAMPAAGGAALPH